ncbi:hypothetical protein EJ08DRAFT_663369 [Tothia fuscella]|uniref:Uncharacterized protein n=1 Tax=Tothia fuscella TaxID=1048955 RepID=A0A9P4NL41_9PEZI|nr:hypothetical protein EJ08DRAFT_663369 [Tothia fuscella]
MDNSVAILRKRKLSAETPVEESSAKVPKMNDGPAEALEIPEFIDPNGIFRIPREVRDMIYHNIFHAANITGPKEFNALTTVFRVNKQFLSETRNMFYSQYYQKLQIVITSIPDLRAFLRTIGNHAHHPHTSTTFQLIMPTQLKLYSYKEYKVYESFLNACRRFILSETAVESNKRLDHVDDETDIPFVEMMFAKCQANSSVMVCVAGGEGVDGTKYADWSFWEIIQGPQNKGLDLGCRSHYHHYTHAQKHTRTNTRTHEHTHAQTHARTNNMSMVLPTKKRAHTEIDKIDTQPPNKMQKLDVDVALGPEKAVKPSGIFSLPRELRDMVYKEVFASNSGATINREAFNLITALFRVSKQFHVETKDLFYKSYYQNLKIVITTIPALRGFLTSIGPKDNHAHSASSLRIFTAPTPGTPSTAQEEIFDKLKGVIIFLPRTKEREQLRSIPMHAAITREICAFGTPFDDEFWKQIEGRPGTSLNYHEWSGEDYGGNLYIEYLVTLYDRDQNRTKVLSRSPFCSHGNMESRKRQFDDDAIDVDLQPLCKIQKADLTAGPDCERAVVAVKSAEFYHLYMCQGCLPFRPPENMHNSSHGTKLTT